MTLAILIAILFLTANPSSNNEKYWPQWRGPAATGVAPLAKPPLEWSEGKNIRWKIEIPGKGSSSPIVWGDRIYPGFDSRRIKNNRQTPIKPIATASFVDGVVLLRS